MFSPMIFPTNPVLEERQRVWWPRPSPATGKAAPHGPTDWKNSLSGKVRSYWNSGNLCLYIYIQTWYISSIKKYGHALANHRERTTSKYPTTIGMLVRAGWWWSPSITIPVHQSPGQFGLDPVQIIQVKNNLEGLVAAIRKKWLGFQNKRTKQGGNLAEMCLRFSPSAIKILNTKPMACYLSFSFSSLFSFSLFIFSLGLCSLFLCFSWSLFFFSLFLFL
jgi:hypothetical protein